MSRRLFFAGLLIAFLTLAPLVVSAETPRLVRVASFNYYPAIFLDDDGRVKGFYVDLFDEIARQENLRIEYVHGSWAQGLERIRGGEVDLLTSVAWTEERSAFMDYGRVPLLTVWSELYVRTDATLTGIKDVAGKKIAVMKGDYNGRYVADILEKFGLPAEFHEFADFTAVFEAVRRGQVDAGVANVLFGEARAAGFELKSTGVLFSPFDVYFTTAKGQNTELLALLDRYLEDWKSGETSIYHQARLKWQHPKEQPGEILPTWVYQALGVLLALALGALGFVVLLRREVRRKTEAVRQREEQLRDSHEAYQCILRTAHDGFWLTDTQGVILDVNDTYARQSGYGRDELIGMRISDLEAHETPEETATHVGRLMEKGSDLFETMHRRKDGSTWDVEISCTHGPFGGGRFTVFVRDISARKQADAALREKNEEMERLVYTVSHDLRTPLITIKAYLGFLQQDLAAHINEEVATDMGHMHAAADKMERLLEELLHYSRVGRLNPAVVDIGFRQLVDEGCKAVAGRLASRRIEVKVSDADLVLHGDPLRLAQIWQNLIDNAAKYMGDQAVPRIDIGVEDQGAVRVFFVRDNGMGIAPHNQEKIFGLFDQIDKHSEGTGLGLALVKRIVESYRGRIWVESQGAGQGSCFRFTLPEALPAQGEVS